MRPAGDVARALYSAAAVPGTVKDFCQRAQVGYAVGRYTASRMLRRGDLVPLQGAGVEGAAPATLASAPTRGRRPVLLVAARAPVVQGLPAQQALWAEAA